MISRPANEAAGLILYADAPGARGSEIGDRCPI